MGQTNRWSLPRTFRVMTRGLVAIATCVFTVACKEDEPTAPDGGRDSAVTSLSATAIPPWMPAWIAALPADATPVWNACNAAGTVNQSGTPFVIGTNCRMMRVNQYPRRYVVYVPNHPDVVNGNDVPLVMMYHGSGQSGERHYTQSAWREEADANGFIVVFPSGLEYQLLTGGTPTKWNSYDLAAEINPAWKPTGYPAGAPWPADDSTFTHRLLNDLIAQANIDTLRLHASGFSNGGSMVSRLAIEHSDRFASMASITGPYAQERIPLARIPYFFATGTLDGNAIAEINANLLPLQAPVASVPLDTATIFSYLALDQRRDSMSATFDLDPDPTVVTTNAIWTLMKWKTALPGNGSGNEAWWGIIRGVEHEYPRGPGRNFPSNNPLGFDAPRTFWNFFRTHTK